MESLGLLQMDPLAGMGSLNLGGTAASHNPGFPTSLSSAFSNPQSPAKAFPALSNPNPSTPFGGIGSLSTQLSGMEPANASVVGQPVLNGPVKPFHRLFTPLSDSPPRSLELRYWIESGHADGQHGPLWHQEDEHTRPEPTDLSAE